MEQSGEGVEITHVVPRPVLELRVKDLELEGQDAIKEERPLLRGLDGVQDGEQIRAFCGRLIEQAHASQGGQPEVP